VTFHSADDTVCDWSPDGTQILFQSAREGRFQDLYTISLKDNRLRRLTSDRSGSRYGAWSPDGTKVAYARGGQEWWRPKYRGSRSSELYVVTAASGKSSRLTNYTGFDSWPLYGPDGTLFYVSHQEGASELYRMGPGAQGVVKLTTGHTDPIRFPSISRDGSTIVYESGFELHTLTLKGNRPSQHLALYAPSDQLMNWKERATMTSGAASQALSADGKTMAIAVRGELWTIPTDKGGDATRMTKTAAQEASPVWSPDGLKLAYATDRAGSLDVYLMDVKTKAETAIAADAANDVNPHFSPDGRFLSFVRTGGSAPGLYVVPFGKDYEVKPTDVVRVGPGTGVGGYDWSPDSRWLAYSRRHPTGTTDIWIVPGVGGTPVNVTQ
jgi:tricorn protease